MNSRRRFYFVAVIIFLFITVFSNLPVAAADKSKPLTYKSELETKYGMKIRGEGSLLTGKDAMSYLNAYDKAMNLFTVAFIKELITLFEKVGVTTSIKFSKYNEESGEDGSYEIEDDRAVIDLSVESPYTGKPTMGADPQTITHEVGHMLYYGICEKYGEDKFNRDWEAVNDDYPYGEWEEYYEYVYVSEYASTDCFEDFAEIIAYILTDPDLVCDRTSEPDGYVLMAKVNFIEKVVKKYFTTFKGYETWGYTGSSGNFFEESLETDTASHARTAGEARR